ncbi:MAG: TetR family transcriptional regulator [Microthrixaceae bacterium]
MAVEEGSRREQKRRATHRAITDAAWGLFSRNGFDATTVDQIAAEAQVSQRTFFRYFDSKEAVLFGDWRQEYAEIERLVRGRPAGEEPMVALLGALLSLADYYEAQRDMMMRRAHLVATSPNVGRYQQVTIEPAFQTMLAEALAERLGVDVETDLRPGLYAAVGRAVIATAVARWMAQPDGVHPAEVVREVFALLPAPPDVEAVDT